MGEVYRARDTTLHRPVAIKVLPETFARDPERIARLQREARTLASLNDPNIAAIFGFQDADGRHALVLELVEGPTLADRIAGGPLPIPECLAIARQIARALDAAHQQGIVHRDLKPANIKVREDGTVKVLDFGLSKALETGSAPDASATPTVTSPAVLTGAGVIIGSAAYMSPEQAKGQAADKRADIWAFGCVLYEMATGQRAFEGTGVTETLAAVLRGEPDWSALPADLPAAARTLLVRCLEKDRSERVQDISTARFILAEQGSLVNSAASPSLASPSRARRLGLAGWVAAAAVLGIAAGAAAVALLGPRNAGPGRAVRLELATPREAPVAVTAFGSLVALSPDGSSLVYTAAREGGSVLMLKRLDALEVRPISGSEGGIDPFFSPDGQQVGFITAGELRHVPIRGGASVTVYRGDPTFEGAVWCRDGTIVFSNDMALYRVDANGGQPTKIAAPDPAQDEMGYDRPQLLPGDGLVYTVHLRGNRSRIAARRLKGGDAVTVIEEGFGARYLPPGYLVYAQADRLMAVAFDASTLRASGTPLQIEESAFTNSADGVSNVAAAADGTGVFVSGRNSGSLGRPVWVDRSGKHGARIGDQPLEDPRNVRLSPDGKRLALTIGPPGLGNIWIYDLSGSRQPIKLTFSDHNTFPVWTPDGRQIVFMRTIGTEVRDLIIAADGSAVQAQPVAASVVSGVPADFSPDGSALLLYRASTLWLLHPPRADEVEWNHSPFSQFGARFAPNGRWVAYGSTQNGTADVWVRPFPNGAPLRVSANDGGHDPIWAADGNELYYLAGNKMMAARVSTAEPELRFEAPRMLFEGGFRYDTNDLVLRYYDVAPDGRFVMVEPTEANSASVVVTQHWADEITVRLR